MRPEIMNLCKADYMSVCTANCCRDQQGCSFYEQSQHASRCMYFVFDEYCDCLKAQLNAREMDSGI
jgi:hypothetical protein